MLDAPVPELPFDFNIEELWQMVQAKQKEFEESELYTMLQEGIVIKYTDGTEETITLDDVTIL